jgi:ferredoxin
MKVTIDAEQCQGHARCWTICPEVFDLDEQGHAVLTGADITAELEGKVQQAASNCPEGAITVTR